jgi:outer membrane lipoprotein-sorting protein
MKHFKHQTFGPTRTCWTGVLLLIFLLAGIAAAQSGPAGNTEEILARIETRVQNVSTFAAHFTQKRVSKLLSEPLVSQGSIYFARDGKMLMQIDTPSTLKVLFEGQYLTVVNPERVLVHKKRISATDRMMTLWMDFGKQLTAKDRPYNVQLTASPGNKGYRLTLTPQREDLARHIAAITIDVDAANLLPAQVVISEPGGDQTTLQLRFLSINKPLPDGIFTITIPEEFQSR